MPEFVNNNVGSFDGTKEEEGTIVCALDSKKFKNLLRISDAFMGKGYRNKMIKINP